MRPVTLLALFAALFFVASGALVTPSAIDWRNNGFVTPVKNQGSCGASYAFSAAAVIESALLKNRHASYDFSEQQLINCMYGKLGYQFNFGCQGGDPARTIQYALQNGLSTEAQYPYISGQTKTHGSCRSMGSFKPGFTLYSVTARDEDALAAALTENGPITITLNAKNNEFYNYRGGIYNNPACSTQINQAALLIGYSEQNSQKYWIIKNSWGTAWGKGSYIKLTRGYNRCGIVSTASYFVH